MTNMTRRNNSKKRSRPFSSDLFIFLLGYGGAYLEKRFGGSMNNNDLFLTRPKRREANGKIWKSERHGTRAPKVR